MFEALMNASRIHPIMEQLFYTTKRTCVSTSQAPYGQFGSEAVLKDVIYPDDLLQADTVCAGRLSVSRDNGFGFGFGVVVVVVTV
jgi:hypothetical protein